MHSEPASKQQTGGAWVLKQNLQFNNLNQQMHLLSIYLCVCVCLCMCMHSSVFHGIHIEIRGELEESIISFHHVGHGN